MAIEYHIYANDGAGGPVDYTSPIGTTASRSFETAPLAASTDTTFAVRAFDSESGLEEENTDARVRIVLDTSGSDISMRPAPPIGLTAEATAGGVVRVRWMAPTTTLFGRPLGYRVYQGSPWPSFDAPALEVSATDARLYVADLKGLSDGEEIQICVRSYNASGEEANTTFIAIAADATGPDLVELLTAAPTFER